MSPRAVGGRLHLMHLDHLIDAAVTDHAAHTRRDMGLVVNINKVGQAMNLYPRNGLAGRVTLAHPLQTRAVLLNLRMAVHAGAGGGHRSKSGFENGRMAVETIQTQL